MARYRVTEFHRLGITVSRTVVADRIAAALRKAKSQALKGYTVIKLRKLQQ